MAGRGKNPKRPRRRPGPPSLLSPAIEKQICDLIREGNYLETACASAGVDWWTVREWLKRGARAMRAREPSADDAPYVEFRKACLAAEASVEGRHVKRFAAAGKKDWRADESFLERRFQKKWGKQFNVTVQAELGAFLDALERKLPPEVFALVLDVAESREGGENEAQGAASSGPVVH